MEGMEPPTLPIPEYTHERKDMRIFISDYAVNSGLAAMHKYDALVLRDSMPASIAR